jgi:Flp pilus assembly protein TadD
MSADREEQFKQLVEKFPNSPMGHFSLGKWYLEVKRYPEAVKALEEAVRLDSTYAAALMSLGYAYEGLADKSKARAALERAREVALEQKHPSLAEEIDEHLSQL